MIQGLTAQMGEVNVTFKELVHKILDGSNTSRIFDGRIRWEETYPGGIRICTALITGTKVTLPNNVVC